MLYQTPLIKNFSRAFEIKFDLWNFDKDIMFKKHHFEGTWATQSVKPLTSAQVREFKSALGSVPTAQSLEPASDSVSPSLSPPPLLTLCLCLFLSQK